MSRYASFNRRLTPIALYYSIDGLFKTRDHLKKYLSILFNPNLNFHHHIESISCKAIKTLELIKRISSDFKLLYSYKVLNCSLVRLDVEYGFIP